MPKTGSTGGTPVRNGAPEDERIRSAFIQDEKWPTRVVATFTGLRDRDSGQKLPMSQQLTKASVAATKAAQALGDDVTTVLVVTQGVVANSLRTALAARRVHELKVMAHDRVEPTDGSDPFYPPRFLFVVEPQDGKMHASDLAYVLTLAASSSKGVWPD